MNKLLQIGVSVALLTVISLQMDWAKVAQAFADLRVELWLAAVTLVVAGQCISAMRWQIFARGLRFERSLGQFTGFYFIGMYFNLVLPTSVGGDVVRAWYLDGRSGRRMAALATVFLDRLSGLLVLLTMAGLGVLLSPLDLPAWVCWSVAGLCASAVSGLAFLALLSHRVPYARRYASQMKTVLGTLRQPAILLPTTFLSILVQISSVAQVWLVGTALGLPIPASFYWVLVPLVSLLTLLPISVNGMGVREGAAAVLLAPWIARDPAFILAFLWFGIYVAASLCGGLVYVFGHFPKPEAPAASSGDVPGEVSDDYGSVDRDTDQGRTGQFKAAA